MLTERPASPCNRGCTLDDDDICLGCGRSLDEIRNWYTATNEECREILERSARRRAERAIIRATPRD